MAKRKRKKKNRLCGSRYTLNGRTHPCQRPLNHEGSHVCGDLSWAFAGIKGFRKWSFDNWPFCFYCGCRLLTLKATTVDHVIPVSKGGHNDLGNVVLCCKRCNQAKSDGSLEDFFRLSLMRLASCHRLLHWSMAKTLWVIFKCFLERGRHDK